MSEDNETPDEAADAPEEAPEAPPEPASAPSDEGVDYASIGGILGQKLKMTQMFTEDGRVEPVTVIQCGPCHVLQVKTPESDGYKALQLGFGDRKLKRVKKPQQGHIAKAGVEGGVAFIREVPFAGDEPPAEVGRSVLVSIFEPGATIDVVGTSKGRGFSGTIRRHGFHRGPMTHGSHNVRAPGSIGMAADPARVFKGMKMPGQLGNARVTVKNLTVVKVIPEKNLLLVRGGVPGPSGAYVVVKKAYFGSGS